ncbi:MAG TPA: nucleotide exchange factor GrpE [Anaeromyxobacter sp.]
MADSDDKGAFQADIPVDAVQEALRSVERIAKGDAHAPAEAAAGEGAAVAVEVEPADADGLAREVETLKAQVELSTAKGRETLERLKEEHDRYLRAAADHDNYKKRAAKERDEVQKFGNERLLKDLFPVVDGLDRALAAAPPDDPLVEGVRLVRASLEQALAKHGVSSFSALGEKFDPAHHEALLQVPTREKPPGTVVLEHARGFRLNDRLVRPAMVGVAVEPPAADPTRPSST